MNMSWINCALFIENLNAKRYKISNKKNFFKNEYNISLIVFIKINLQTFAVYSWVNYELNNI